MRQKYLGYFKGKKESQYCIGQVKKVNLILWSQNS